MSERWIHREIVRSIAICQAPAGMILLRVYWNWEGEELTIDHYSQPIIAIETRVEDHYSINATHITNTDIHSHAEAIRRVFNYNGLYVVRRPITIGGEIRSEFEAPKEMPCHNEETFIFVSEEEMEKELESILSQTRKDQIRIRENQRRIP